MFHFQNSMPLMLLGERPHVIVCLEGETDGRGHDLASVIFVHGAFHKVSCINENEKGFIPYIKNIYV